MVICPRAPESSDKVLPLVNSDSYLGKVGGPEAALRVRVRVHLMYDIS